MVAHSVCCTGQRGREKGVQVRELCAGSRAPAVAPNYSAILRLPEQHSGGALATVTLPLRTCTLRM